MFLQAHSSAAVEKQTASTSPQTADTSQALTRPNGPIDLNYPSQPTAPKFSTAEPLPSASVAAVTMGKSDDAGCKSCPALPIEQPSVLGTAAGSESYLSFSTRREG